MAKMNHRDNCCGNSLCPGIFSEQSGELCGAEITGPKTFSGTFAAAKN